MALRQSLRQAVRLLRSQPILFVPMAIFAVLQLPQLFIETLDPVVSMIASLAFSGLFLFVTPVFYAGTIGMANDAASGQQTSLGRFWAHARSFYVTVLIAYLFITVISIGFGVLFSIVVFVVVLTTVGVGSASLPLLVGVGGAVALFVLAFLIVLFAVHFYAHAIVIEGTGAIAGLSRSVEVVRQHLKPVIGYGLFAVVFGVILGGLYAAIFTLVLPSSPAPGEPAPMPELGPALFVAGASIVGTALFVTFFAVFSVCFYRALVGADESAGPAAGDGSVADSEPRSDDVGSTASGADRVDDPVGESADRRDDDDDGSVTTGA